MTQNPNNQRHIFLVDDDQEDRELFAEALSCVSDSNVKFTEISSAAMLIENLNDPLTSAPELIFMDINMPKISGIDCLKKLKGKDGKFNQLNVVMYSTYSNADDIKEAFQQGASRYYVKPTLFDHLKELISGALDINWNKIGGKSRENFFVDYGLI
ncbi:MAG: response regulator [Flavobacterium sp.]